MKTFGEVEIGDQIYIIEDDFGVTGLYVSGIEDVGLKHKQIIIKTVHGASFSCNSELTKQLMGNLTIFSCLEAVQSAREKIKKEYANKQFVIAMQAFRRLKKVTPDYTKQKQRVLKFFQILEEEDNA